MTPAIPNDVFDPTNDPRHAPPTELPGANPNVPKPRDVDPAQPPPPDEPVICGPGTTAKAKPAGNPE